MKDRHLQKKENIAFWRAAWSLSFCLSWLKLDFNLGWISFRQTKQPLLQLEEDLSLASNAKLRVDLKIASISMLQMLYFLLFHTSFKQKMKAYSFTK